MDLEISKSETDKYFRQQESLSSQLQVVYEHRARLERSLQKEKTDHKNTKLDFAKKQNDFILNITRSKHEAMNRFNSLETQYNMLKAQNKELDTDYNRLRQQYTRLSSEHSQLNNQLKRNFQLYKEQKTNEIASLDEEIKTLKQQVVSLRTHLKSRADEVEQYKLSSSQALAANQKQQETVKTLQEQLASYKEKLKKTQLRSDVSVKDVKNDKDKTAVTRRQGGNLLDSVKDVVDREEKEKSHQERESRPGPSRSDSRHPAKDTSQERYHGQTYIPTTPTSDADSEDENDDEQKQDVHGDSHSDQRHVKVPSREESKRNENSQRESEQRHDNVPLRDSNEDIRRADREPGVQVVAPTGNTMNKWANIIKAAQQGNAPEGGKTEDNNKGEEEGEEEENEEGRSRRSVDDYRQEESDMQRQERDRRLGRPVAQAGRDSDVRQEETPYQGDNAQRAQQQYEHRNPDNQQQEINDNDKKEDHKKDQDGLESDLSRKNINKQVAEMQQHYDQKQIKQQEVMTLPQEQGGEIRQKSVYRQVAPIPAVRQRQDIAAEGHKDQSDADNDDEDADTEQDTEQDPDDADEEDDDVIEPQDSPQEQQPAQQVRPIQGQAQPHQERTYGRALKYADKQNEQKE
ncbi:hypothetical protein ACROYT_G022339 [Oculina patagonica]